MLPNPGRFRFALLMGWLARPFRGLLSKLGFHAGAAALEVVPARLPRLKLRKGKTVFRTERPPIKRVALMLGCVQEVLQPSINRAAIRLLRRHGVEVILAKDEACCGALQHHLGREDEAHKAARRNVDAWSSALREGQLDAILITASGCGTMVKDYGHLLARDRGYAGRAAEMSQLARDITEFIYEIGLVPPLAWTSLRVAYHAACSLQHGQQVDSRAAGAAVPGRIYRGRVPEGHICCGSAGTYNILQPELSGQLRERKLGNIASVKPDVVATGNIGCITQLAARQLRPRGPHRRAARLGDRRSLPEGAREPQIQGASDQSLMELAAAR